MESVFCGIEILFLRRELRSFLQEFVRRTGSLA